MSDLTKRIKQRIIHEPEKYFVGDVVDLVKLGTILRIIDEESAKEENEISALKKENEQLKNRCHAFTNGMLCVFCPCECKHRTTEFRGDVNNNE